MFLRTFLVLCGLHIAAVRANFGGGFQGQTQFQNGGFNNGGFDNGFNGGGFNGGGFVPVSSQTSSFGNHQVQRQGSSGGNSAAAGNAGALGLGTASSINQANHQANQFGTQSSGLSANTAQGTMGSNAGGAAQAGGQVSNELQSSHQFGTQNAMIANIGGGFRRKRHLYGNYGGDFGFYNPQSQANANSVGGGSANWGQVATNNNAFSQTNAFGGTGFAAGNSEGSGQGVNIFQAANTNSASGTYGRRKRQIWGGYGNSNANSIGGGSAFLGRVSTNNNAFSRSDPYSATGFGAGNSQGEGQGVNIFSATNTNAGSGIYGR